MFFESTEKLQKFYTSPELNRSELKERVRIMTEETLDLDKESIIRQAVCSNTITLLSRAFGRGTDFICYDERLEATGGVHVLQTFISEDISEETQIKGPILTVLKLRTKLLLNQY